MQFNTVNFLVFGLLICSGKATFSIFLEEPSDKDELNIVSFPAI